MKKAELENHRADYQALLDQAEAALAKGSVHEAVDLATAAWEFVDGMMRYERKYESREFKSIKAIEIVLQYAPLLFHAKHLAALEDLLQSQHRIDKNTSTDLSDALALAHRKMEQAYDLWTLLERETTVMQSELGKRLGGSHAEWRAIVEAWLRMRVLRREPSNGSYRLSLVTRMSDAVAAKCSNCGVVGKAPKLVFLKPQVCPKCKATAHFVIRP